MKDMYFKLCCTTLFWTICIAHLQAETAESIYSNPVKCSKEELMTFFPQRVVQSILAQANLSKEQAAEIAQELAQKDRELAKIVEDKASRLEPNPFKDLSQRDLAIKIYRETLYEVFAKVLKSHGVTNDDQIQTLLEEIQIAKSKLFIECIRKQQSPNSPMPSSSSS